MAKQPKSLNGKLVVITGGARGIGKATTAALIRQGAKVAIGDLDLPTAQQTAQELGPNVTAFEVDVTNVDSFAAFLQQVEEQVGPPDAIVNNAGIMQLGNFATEPHETARRQIDINLHGVITGTKLVIPGMVRRGNGHIINIASQAGKTGFPGGATYCAVKHAVVGLSEAVRGEVRGTGVEVSVVLPGIVNTELAAGVDEARGVKNQEPEDVANAIVKTLQYPRFEVHVPGYLRYVDALVRVLPYGVQERMMSFLKADRVLLEIDNSRRSGYEDRASHSEPEFDDAAAGGKDGKEKAESAA